jgi:hypothetical protein
MFELTARHSKQIAELCRRFGVQRLDRFGSAARGDFNPETSDLDFLVLFDRTFEIDAADLFDDACRWTMAGIRARHPGISKEDALTELRRIIAVGSRLEWGTDDWL